MYIGRLIEELSGLVEQAEKAGHRAKPEMVKSTVFDEKEHSEGRGGAAENPQSQAEKLP